MIVFTLSFLRHTQREIRCYRFDGWGPAAVPFCATPPHSLSPPPSLFRSVLGEKDLTERGFKWNNDEGRVQHDAHELIRLLIDRLEMDMKFSKINSGLVSALYEGELANQVRWESGLGQIVFDVAACVRCLRSPSWRKGAVVLSGCVRACLGGRLFGMCG